MTIKYQLLNGKVIKKALTSHKCFNKVIFSFHLFNIYCSFLYNAIIIW